MNLTLKKVACKTKLFWYLCISSEKIECPVLCERQWIPKNKDSVNQTKSKQEDAEEEEDTYFQVFRASKDPEGIKIVGVDDNRYKLNVV